MANNNKAEKINGGIIFVFTCPIRQPHVSSPKHRDPLPQASRRLLMSSHHVAARHAVFLGFFLVASKMYLVFSESDACEAHKELNT